MRVSVPPSATPPASRTAVPTRASALLYVEALVGKSALIAAQHCQVSGFATSPSRSHSRNSQESVSCVGIGIKI